MAKETVLISGGAGYIGSHTAVELIAAGYDAVIIDNLSNSEAEAVEGVRRITGVDVPFERVDTCDEAALRRVFEKYDFGSVIHFAAYKAVGESVAEPLKYYRNNLASFMNVCALMKEFGRPNILFSSSATVYGEPDTLPVTEQTPRKPATSPYGNTKQMAEDILHDCCAAYEGLHGIAACRRIWCPTSPRRPPDCANAFRSSATTTTRPTAPACVTTSTSSTWPKPT